MINEEYEEYCVDSNPYNKDRKNKLSKSGKIKCAFCKYHRDENSERVPYERKNKKHSLKNRDSIRKFIILDDDNED